MQQINEKMLKSKMGKLIAKKRKSLNISQEALAEKLDIDVRTVGKIETGRSFVTAETLCKLSQIFDMPLKYFFDIEDSKPKDESNLTQIIDILSSGGEQKINYYYEIITLIEKRYRL